MCSETGSCTYMYMTLIKCPNAHWHKGKTSTFLHAKINNALCVMFAFTNVVAYHYAICNLYELCLHSNMYNDMLFQHGSGERYTFSTVSICMSIFDPTCVCVYIHMCVLLWFSFAVFHLSCSLHLWFMCTCTYSTCIWYYCEVILWFLRQLLNVEDPPCQNILFLDWKPWHRDNSRNLLIIIQSITLF